MSKKVVDRVMDGYDREDRERKRKQELWTTGPPNLDWEAKERKRDETKRGDQVGENNECQPPPAQPPPSTNRPTDWTDCEHNWLSPSAMAAR